MKKAFKPTAWAVDNKVSVFVLTMILGIAGLIAYNGLPKEQFPEVVIPTVYVGTPHPGTSPQDMETLITRPIEKQLKSMTGVKKITSNSIQDFSAITIEFQTDVEPSIAKQRVSDAVDKAMKDLPNDLEQDPNVMEVDFSEFPVMAINVSGDYDNDDLKRFAEDIQDRVESFKEITRADMIGALEKEVQVNLDLYRIQAAGISFEDVRKAIANENINIAGGEINVDKLERTLRVVGEYDDVRQIKDIIVRSSRTNPIYLRDIADVEFTYADQKSFARLNREPVIALNVIKKSGENLVEAADKIYEVIEEMKETVLPPDVKVTLTNDLSVATRVNLAELINSVVIGFILVTVVLMFFMGVQNAMFVGIAVPLSSAISFMFMPPLEFTFNIVVTFSFLLALGIIVDNAIVVIENTYRLHTKEGMDLREAAKEAAGEVFSPVLSGTLTTLSPFVPLLFWPGMIGEFMMFIPAILIITLTASLFVAFIINPVFAVQYMERKESTNNNAFYMTVGTLIVFGLLILLGGSPMLGNLLIMLGLLGLLNKLFITPYMIEPFQNSLLPAIMNMYRSLLAFVLKGYRPILTLVCAFFVLIGAVWGFIQTAGEPELFPQSDPNYIYAYVEMPIGTRAPVTDSVTQIVENRIFDILGDNNPLVKSIISNVGIGAGDPQNPDRSVQPQKGKVTVALVEYAKRNGASTADLLTEVREKISDLPGVRIAVDKENNGPPTGKPINIEIAGDDFDELVALSEKVRYLLVDSLNIQGIEDLKSDLELSKPEIIVEIDREKANQEGISSGQIGSALRTSIFGLEVSKYREGEEEYPIQVRIKEEQRQDLSSLINMPLTFREMNGTFRQVPISAIADVRFQNTYGGINRRDLKRVITLGSNVLQGYGAGNVNAEIRAVLGEFQSQVPAGYSIRQTGEQEDMEETNAFLGTAFGFAILLVFFILVTQFNSTIKPVIIMTTIILSIGGVFFGYFVTGMTMSVVMSGVGIIALSGIVVNNGILLIDFTDEILRRGSPVRVAVREGGAVRFTPVILTAVSTLLGLVPLAIGLNVDFALFLETWNPGFSFGSDNTAFWSPLASAIIFGLGFSTVMTLIVVPCMYIIQYGVKARYRYARSRGNNVVFALIFGLIGSTKVNLKRDGIF